MKDIEIIEKCLNGKTHNYDLIVKRYQKNVIMTAVAVLGNIEEAEDIAQEVFIKVWKNLDKFRADAQLYTWIYRIATNECLTFLDKKKRRYFLPIGDVEGELLKKIDNSPHVDGDEIQMKLQKALLKLPNKQRLVFNMKYFDDMKYEDIAEITDTSVGALKASYHHAVKKIEENINID